MGGGDRGDRDRARAPGARRGRAAAPARPRIEAEPGFDVAREAPLLELRPPPAPPRHPRPPEPPREREIVPVSAEEAATHLVIIVSSRAAVERPGAVRAPFAYRVGVLA